MHSVVQTLVAEPILTLFVVIGLGYVLGQVELFGFRLGVAGVLFIGIAIGALDKAISIPEIVPSLGLIIFVYTIGIQSGPAFFASFRKKGSRDNLLALGMLIAVAALTFAIGSAMHFSHARIAGLFSGSLTNTPAAAAARERIRYRAVGEGLSAEQVRDLSDEPIVAFGLAYPLGVIGVLLSFQVMRRVWRVKAMPPEDKRSIRSQDFVVSNPGIVGISVAELLQLHPGAGFVISRVRQGDETRVAHPELRFAEGDIVVVVGDEVGLARARNIFGESSKQQIESDRSELDFQRFFVSSPQVVGKRIGELGLETNLLATITRVRRGDVDVVPAADTRLEFGDLVRVVSRESNFAAIAQFFGNSIRGTAETDFGSVAIGMVLGALVGMLPVPLPGGNVVRLGLAGGPLMVALVLGKLEHTGKINWTMPVSANLTLRQIGLLLFLAGVGTKAGYSFAQTLRSNGWQMIVIGGAVTTISAIVTLTLAHRVLKMPFDSAMGIVSGMHTEPASLTYASGVSGNELPNVAYATVYPLAMITKIVIAQLLV